MQWDDRDLYWIAGLLEGEGCFYLTTRRNSDGSPRPLLSVLCQMTDEDVIERLAELIGFGNVNRREPKQSNWKPVWTWQCSDVERLLPLLTALRPIMGARRADKIDQMLTAAAGWERRYVREHGRFTMYLKGCRCAFCRAANTARQREYRAKRAAHGGPLRSSPAR